MQQNVSITYNKFPSFKYKQLFLLDSEITFNMSSPRLSLHKALPCSSTYFTVHHLIFWFSIPLFFTLSQSSYVHLSLQTSGRIFCSFLNGNISNIVAWQPFWSLNTKFLSGISSLKHHGYSLLRSKVTRSTIEYGMGCV